MSSDVAPRWKWIFPDWPEPGYYRGGWILDPLRYPEIDYTVQPFDQPRPRVYCDCFVVFVGRNPGLYYTWKEARKQVNDFVGCQFIRCISVKEAQVAWHLGADVLQLEQATDDLPSPASSSPSPSPSRESPPLPDYESQPASPVPPASQLPSQPVPPPASPSAAEPREGTPIPSENPPLASSQPVPPAKSRTVITISSDEDEIRPMPVRFKGKNVMRVRTPAVLSALTKLQSAMAPFPPSSPGDEQPSSRASAPSTRSTTLSSASSEETKGSVIDIDDDDDSAIDIDDVDQGGPKAPFTQAAAPSPLASAPGPSSSLATAAGPSSSLAASSFAPSPSVATTVRGPHYPFVWVVLRGRRPGVYRTHALAMAKCGPFAEGKIVSSRSESHGQRTFTREFMKGRVVRLK
ncbi:hypothetical protein PsYK624_168440 [Phanerochaete sordida]|uniref:Ribonuclease H1 N-terminal domain-containing protein n=1 Tax=Phanerochaete sordida TaxID=48140 RepID=A0A9P3GRJ5_9APHY|nr:hypothetical protein PsYK624_168440 [Phanerochaete sordida]